jgi:hypothetical protein
MAPLAPVDRIVALPADFSQNCAHDPETAWESRRIEESGQDDRPDPSAFFAASYCWIYHLFVSP